MVSYRKRRAEQQYQQHRRRVKKKGLIKGSKLFRLSAQELVEIEEELGMEPYQGAFPVYLTPEEQKVAKKLGFIQEGE